jgi:hypothetical protein
MLTDLGRDIMSRALAEATASVSVFDGTPTRDAETAVKWTGPELRNTIIEVPAKTRVSTVGFWSADGELLRTASLPSVETFEAAGLYVLDALTVQVDSAD